jgi:hypothetical protein
MKFLILACAEGDIQTCYVPNGKGTKVCKSGIFEACVATECDADHVLLDGLCDATSLYLRNLLYLTYF